MTTRWTGKIIGGLIGLFALGPFGAALGAVLGHQYDQGAAGPGAGATGNFGTHFFSATFEVMGHLAKADGRVSEREIAAARAVMAALRLDEASVRAAIACFQRGKQPAFDYGGAIQSIRRACVGRPDLFPDMANDLAGRLFDSLHGKLLKLPDYCEVYPAHGAGSLCGKSLSKETWSTLGNQRKFNYALQPMTKEKFAKIVAADQPEVPAYFPKSAAKNLEGSAPLTDLAKPQEFSTEEIQAFDGVVIDIRQNLEYGEKHIPNSINIGLGGQFASWAGTLVPIGTPIAIVADNETQVDEACTRLARVGHETVTGFILLHNSVSYTPLTLPPHSSV